MADQLWFIPVSSGSAPGLAMATFPIAPTRDLTNVQWMFSVYPVTQEPPAEVSCLSYNSYTAFTMGTGSGENAKSELRECYASWRWRSCTDDTNILNGGQLAGGTVFARELPIDNDPTQVFFGWNIVDVWAKYRVDVPARLDNVFLSINDRGGNNALTPDLQPVTPAGTWRVATLSFGPDWPGWDDPATNMRVVMSFQGTTNPANVGVVNVDMEWFAIRLREEFAP